MPRPVARAIRAHARSEVPRECCGFLIGAAGHVQYCLPVANGAAGTSRYRVDPRDHLDVRRWLRRLAPPLALVGVYHSHPRGPAVPSARDLAESHYPDWVHVIAGPVSGRIPLAAFRIAHGRATPILLRVG
jgi:proteasome lid subunit RPN8/RPN11